MKPNRCPRCHRFAELFEDYLHGWLCQECAGETFTEKRTARVRLVEVPQVSVREEYEEKLKALGGLQ